MRRAEGRAQNHGIGRSRGGLTTRVHAAVYALGRSVRLIAAAGQRGERPQAAARLGGLEDVGHVITDVAQGTGPLREKIGQDRGAEAHIRAKPSRAIKPSFDPHIFTKRHKVENVLQRIKRFRCIARRCEKTLTSFMGFVFLAAALDWMR